jgi:transposase InsO family protein
MPDFRQEVVTEALRPGANKTAVARRYGISRATLHRWIRRHLVDVHDGLVPWSRAPFHSPAQIDAALEDDIRSMRKEHPRWGARRISGELARHGTPPPAVSTIHQVLVRNGLVQTRARKKRADKRFQRERPHELWQIDASRVAISVPGARHWVMSIIDDHSRALLCSRVCSGPTGEAAIACFQEAARSHGLPREVLSDNGTCFTGRLIRAEVEFERVMKTLGVRQLHSRPMHPQTLGKLERFHRTMKEWLFDNFPVESAAELQAALDRFKDHYNSERPHQALGNRVPQEVIAAPQAIDLVPAHLEQREEGPVHPADATTRTVGKNGAFTYNYLKIAVGVRWAGHRVRVERDGDRITVFHGERLIRTLVLDETRTYQPFKGQRRR